MRLATFNVNSIRLRYPVIRDWLAAYKPDVLCLQETKVQDFQFPLDVFKHSGYHVSFRGMKSYNGVAVFSRKAPERVTFGLADRETFPLGNVRRVGAAYHDADETRFCHAVIDGIHILNTYVPQGYKVDSPKYAYKLKWFKRLRHYFETHFTPSDRVLWCGDLNVAPRDMDVHSPETHKKHVCFHADVRKAYANAISWGFQDVFTTLHPDKQQYTFYDYRKFPHPSGDKTRWLSSLDMNKGWRIDHILATAPIAKRCSHIAVDINPRRQSPSSDHTFLWADFDLT